MGRYIEKDDPQAEMLFERLIGYSYGLALYEEEYEFKKGFGSQIQLRQMPVEVVNCTGFIKNHDHKLEVWVDIPLEDVITHGRVMDIPPSIFGEKFNKVRISYYAGETEIPDSVKDAVEEISKLLAQGVGVWSLPLSHGTLLTIAELKRLQERG